MTELYLIIPAVVILLFFLPVIIELRISFNVLTNTGVISVYLYKKLIVYYIYEIKGSQISLKSEEGGQEELLDLSGAEIVFFTSLVKEVLDKFRGVITENGGQIVSEEDWGLKKLAYPIQKKTTGFYFLVEFTGEGDLIEKLETQYRRDERVIRFLTFKMDKYAVEYAEKRRTKIKKAE